MEINEFKQKLKKSLEFFEEEIQTIRTGRATPGLVEHLRVNYYNVPTPLNQLAAINIPEPRLIVISPYDKSTLPEIEKAISASDLHLTGSNDGNVVRINVPPLNEERRQELIKVVHGKAEEVKVAMRNTRREAVEELEKKEKGGEISEDERFNGEKQIQETLDEFIKEIDEVIDKKEEEIREV